MPYPVKVPVEIPKPYPVTIHKPVPVSVPHPVIVEKKVPIVIKEHEHHEHDGHSLGDFQVGFGGHGQEDIVFGGHF